MKIFMTGGTGFVGTTLARELTAKGHSVTVLMRKVESGVSLPPGAISLEGDPTIRGAWQERVPEHEAFINLAGASIFTRWTDEAKRVIRESRILTTRHLVEAMAPRKGKETHLFSTSGAGYYGYHEDEELSEESPPGTDFLAMLSREWEAEAVKATEHGVRVVLCRFGIVMGRNGGMLGEIVPIFRMFLGANLGSGNQWLSWIHEQDLARIFLFLLENRGLEGPLNCTAPEPVRNQRVHGDARQGPGGAHLPAPRSRFHASIDEGGVRGRHPQGPAGAAPEAPGGRLPVPLPHAERGLN